MYDGMKVYGPYTRKDGRQIVVLKTPNKHDNRTISYPKYLVEIKLGRYLKSDEQIDHIDGNFLNNDYSNLRIVNQSLHVRSHVSRKEEIVFRCPICGKQVKTKESSRVTCGNKRCVGPCAHILGHNKGNDFCHFRSSSYYNTRDRLSEISTVDSLSKIKQTDI